MTGGPSGQDAEEPDSTLDVLYFLTSATCSPFDPVGGTGAVGRGHFRRHGCSVYVVLVDDYEDFGSGDVYDVTTQIYHSEQNGFRNGRWAGWHHDPSEHGGT